MDVPNPSHLKAKGIPKPNFRDIKDGLQKLPGRMLSLKDFRRRQISGLLSPRHPHNSSIRFADITRIMDSPRQLQLHASRSQPSSRVVSRLNSPPSTLFEPLRIGAVGYRLHTSPRSQVVINIDTKLPYTPLTKSPPLTERTARKAEKPHLAIFSVEFQGAERERQLHVPNPKIASD